MHISEGILNIATCAGGYALAAALTAYSLKKTDNDEVPAIAVMGAAFFTASLIHFKVGVTSVHLTLLGLTAVILGKSSLLAILAGMFFQAVMFQHGGISTLGVNSVIMMLPALIMQQLFRILTIQKQEKLLYVSVVAGILTFLSVILATILVVLILLFSGQELTGIAVFFSVSNSALALVEGVLSAIIVYRLLKIKPEMIGSWKTA